VIHPVEGLLVDEQVIRAWWAHRQGLDGSLSGASAAKVLEQTGWQRSLGGVGAYLPLFARAGLSREAIDASVAVLEMQELPAARGCMYVVPASTFALALRVGQGCGDEAEIATGKKYFGVTDAELDRLCLAVLDALSAASLQPRAIKDALQGAVREFGPEGQKRGVTSTLPLALGRLEAAGEIRRVPNNGRLDQKRYAYTRWHDNPRAQLHLADEEAHIALARHYFRWIGPARLAHFQWFSGLSAKAAKAAIAPLGLIPLDAGDDRLMFPADREALGAFRPPAEPQVVLTSYFDNLIHLHRDVPGLLATADHLPYLYGDHGAQQMGGLSDLQSHPIFDRGCLIGLWEYEPDTQSIVWATFDPPPPTLPEVVARMKAFVRGELGHSRTFALDDPKRRIPRIAALRQMAT
jgi:Winged helix DNA-binding domain